MLLSLVVASLRLCFVCLGGGCLWVLQMVFNMLLVVAVRLPLRSKTIRLWTGFQWSGLCGCIYVLSTPAVVAKCEHAITNYKCFNSDRVLSESVPLHRRHVHLV